MANKLDKPINGSIDEILEHCSNSDFDITDEQYKEQQYKECINYLMKEENLSEEEAIEIYNEIALQEVKSIVDKFVEDGIMEIQGFDENGEPKFGLTELGKKCAAELEAKNGKIQ